MKKTYIIPETLTTQVSTCQMMAESLNINRGGASISNSNQILIKEEQTSDVNLWDEEW